MGRGARGDEVGGGGEGAGCGVWDLGLRWVVVGVVFRSLGVGVVVAVAIDGGGEVGFGV